MNWLKKLLHRALGVPRRTMVTCNGPFAGGPQYLCVGDEIIIPYTQYGEAGEIVYKETFKLKVTQALVDQVSREKFVHPFPRIKVVLT